MSWIVAALALLALVVIGLKLRSALGKAADPTLELWEQFAKEHDLSFSPGDLVAPATLAGSWKGRAVKIERGPAPLGVLHIKVPTATHLAPELILRREEGAAALGKFAGLQDIQVGHPALDDLLRIQGVGEAHIVSLLSDRAVISRLGQLFSRYPGALVDKDCVSLLRKRTTRPPEDLVALLDALTNAADALDRSNRDLTGSTLGLVDTQEAWTDPAPVLPPPPKTEDILPPVVTEDPPHPIPDPPAVEEEEDDTAPLPDMASPLHEIFEALSDRSLPEAARESILEAVGPLSFVIEIDGVSRSSGDLSEALRGGRTVQAHPPDHALEKLVIRFPPSRNSEIEALRFGERFTVEARPVQWDNFMRVLTLDAVG